MKTLFDNSTYREIAERVEKLNYKTPQHWGKMDVAQMLAHCSEAMEMAIGDKTIKRTVLGRVLGPLIKKSFLSDTPFKQSLPTASEFVIVDKHDFEKQKQRLQKLIERFNKGGASGATKHPHGFFGHLKPEQWGEVQWKHLDHHLRQFGV